MTEPHRDDRPTEGQDGLWSDPAGQHADPTRPVVDPGQPAQSAPGAANGGQLPYGAAPTEPTQAIGEPTREIPRQQPTAPAPGQAPASAPGPAPASAPVPASGSTPIGPASPGRRGGWVVPVAIAGAVLLGGGGALAARQGTAPAAALGDASIPSASASATSDIGSNTEPQVTQDSAVAPDWTKTAAAASPSVVSIDVKGSSAEGQGSGVVIDSKGHIVTNNHVATGAGTGATIMVTLSDQRAYAAKIVGTDPSTDLAVLQLQNVPSDLKAIAFGDSAKLKVGQPVMAVGNPLGLSGTVTTGIVSALNRPVTTSAQEQQDPSQPYQQSPAAADVFTNAIQTSAAINPGNSGGALVDAQGRLVGINSSIASLGGSTGGGQSGNIGIGFAIPVNEVTSIAKQLVATGKAHHAYLGVKAPTKIVKDGDGLREAAVISTVLPNTPAAKAGLKVGDAIIALDGTPITGYTSLISQVYAKNIGDRGHVEYIRNGQRASVDIVFTQRQDG